MKISFLILSFALAICVQSLSAAFISPGFSGTTTYDGWEDLGSYNGVPGFPTMASTSTDPWPVGGINSNTLGSYDAEYTKISGGGYPVEATGIYTFMNAGQFTVIDSTPVASLATVLFQISIEGVGTNFFSAPLLNYNGGGQALAPVSLTLSSTYLGMIFGSPSYLYEIAYQWDLSAINSITAFDIDFTGPEHSVTHAMRLDESSVFTSVIPEPSTYVLLGLGLLFIGVLHRIRSPRIQGTK